MSRGNCFTQRRGGYYSFSLSEVGVILPPVFDAVSSAPVFDAVSSAPVFDAVSSAPVFDAVLSAPCQTAAEGHQNS